MPAAKKTNIELFVISKAKEKREQAGLSQAELAFKLEVSLGFIGQVESPSHPSKYNLNHINKLAEIFNCSPQELLPTRPI
jgi:transcriptional regulator with XRE-family HTH domain